MIQPTDTKRFKELLNTEFRRNGKSFTTDEIRISKEHISIWDEDSGNWHYLDKNLNWVSDAEDEDILIIDEL